MLKGEEGWKLLSLESTLEREGSLSRARRDR